MTRNTRLALYAVPAVLAVLVAVGYGPFTRMMGFTVLRYETGAQFKGAQSCKSCHEEIYKDWKSSFSAQSTKDPYVILVEERQPMIPNRLILGEPCYSCHGPKKLDEGITCEVCHGINDQADVMDVHKTKYSVNLKEIRKSDYCGTCHEAIHPLTTDPIISTLTEWRDSKAAKQGLGCVDCHMKKTANKEAFHGGGSRRVDASIYKDSVAVMNLKYAHSKLSVDIENKITGHYLPTGGPEPAMLMEITLKDASGAVIHAFETAFQRKSGPVMAFPGNLLSDNRLKDGEIRNLQFDVPQGLKGTPSSVVISLKFLDIDFIDLGEVKKSRWQSPVFFEKTFSL